MCESSSALGLSHTEGSQQALLSACCGVIISSKEFHLLLCSHLRSRNTMPLKNRLGSNQALFAHHQDTRFSGKFNCLEPGDAGTNLHSKGCYRSSPTAPHLCFLSSRSCDFLLPPNMLFFLPFLYFSPLPVPVFILSILFQDFSPGSICVFILRYPFSVTAASGKFSRILSH